MLNLSVGHPKIHSSIKVPYRQVALSPTQINGEEQQNQPINLYDCSGPYTDPNQTINIQKGLPQHRKQWILDRNDVEECLDFSFAKISLTFFPESCLQIKGSNRG